MPPEWAVHKKIRAQFNVPYTKLVENTFGFLKNNYLYIDNKKIFLKILKGTTLLGYIVPFNILIFIY
ncbi:MAG TPA: hypothetical protein DEG96_07330 [Candidatus Atribacteria bacterium]|nr:hypothetical protein [Candidatus Atribacteria bacterium]